MLERVPKKQNKTSKVALSEGHILQNSENMALQTRHFTDVCMLSALQQAKVCIISRLCEVVTLQF